MAKGKRSAALFEVINKGSKEKVRTQKSRFSLPKWWSKGNASDSAGHQGAAAGSDVADLKPSVAPMPMAERAAPISAPKRESTGHDSPREASSGLNFFKDFRLHFGYAGALMLLFAVVVCVGLGVIIGKQLGMNSRDFTPASLSVADLRNTPARPDVGRTSAAQGVSAQSPGELPAETASGNTPLSPGTSTAANPTSAVPLPSRTGSTPQQAAGPSTPPVTGNAGVVATAGPREIGLNYIVMQTYPEEAEAKEIVQFLSQNGIAASVERRIMHPQWFSVVGTDGFVRLRGPEYDAYMKRVNAVNQQLIKQNRKFKAFQPTGYKWNKPAGR